MLLPPTTSIIDAYDPYSTHYAISIQALVRQVCAHSGKKTPYTPITVDSTIWRGLTHDERVVLSVCESLLHQAYHAIYTRRLKDDRAFYRANKSHHWVYDSMGISYRIYKNNPISVYDT